MRKLVFGVGAFTALLSASVWGQGVTKGVSVSIPVGRWTAITCDRELVLVMSTPAEKGVEPERVMTRRGLINFTSVPWPRSAQDRAEPRWQTLTLVHTFTPEECPVAGVCMPGQVSQILVAAQVTMGAPNFDWGVLDLQKPIDPGVDRLSLLRSTEEEGRFSWSTISRVDYAGAPQDWFLSVLQNPSVARHSTDVFVAGDTPRPGGLAGSNVWVAPLDVDRKHLREGFVLGRGQSPALFDFNKTFMCVAYLHENPKPDRIVAWKLEGGKWVAWDTGIEADGDISYVDACAKDDKIYVAAVLAQGSVLRVWELGKDAAPFNNKVLLAEARVRHSLGQVKVLVFKDEVLCLWDEMITPDERKIVLKPVTPAENQGGK